MLRVLAGLVPCPSKTRSFCGRPSVRAKIEVRWHQYWIGLVAVVRQLGAPARQALRPPAGVSAPRMYSRSSIGTLFARAVDTLPV
ncbi:hypothetical protein [Ramlibacter montanisoli]|uniref:Uncharacterized protein n=1 Tax=Ramlibacter montanisoli TaxID=2732512 RepID=A0A849K4H6_9BURK|nr:hypothetical protein [Ramlibacter montanisoli]NNU43332.1 hypothetical protein [Ramlibacter montanisoli]